MEFEEYDGIKEDKRKDPPKYFTTLYWVLVIWGVLFMGYYLLSGWSSQNEFKEKMTAHELKYFGQSKDK